MGTKAETNAKPRVLVLGAAGMLGHTVLRFLLSSDSCFAVGSVRGNSPPQFLPADLKNRVLTGVDVENPDVLTRAFAEAKPDIVINCVGLVKQLASADEPLLAIPINSILPHRLASLCQLGGARLIHVSTDCVFSGAKGMYRENDPIDAQDLYGKSKHLGEVDYPHAITLRTSIIGHEQQTSHGLLEWFLAQRGSANGYTRAIFSGLPTVELARVIRDFVMPRPELHGVYHVVSQPISKHDLLGIIAQVYGKSIRIVPLDQPVIDRSLDGTRFRDDTGYVVPPWPELIERMHRFH